MSFAWPSSRSPAAPAPPRPDVLIRHAVGPGLRVVAVVLRVGRGVHVHPTQRRYVLDVLLRPPDDLVVLRVVVVQPVPAHVVEIPRDQAVVLGADERSGAILQLRRLPQDHVVLVRHLDLGSTVGEVRMLSAPCRAWCASRSGSPIPRRGGAGAVPPPINTPAVMTPVSMPSPRSLYPCSSRYVASSWDADARPRGSGGGLRSVRSGAPSPPSGHPPCQPDVELEEPDRIEAVGTFLR